MSLRRLDQELALAVGVRGGLLDVDVLARLAGAEGDRGVPVVRRGDEHRVDRLVVQQVPEVLDDAGRLPLGLLDLAGGGLPAARIDVADRRDRRVFTGSPGDR